MYIQMHAQPAHMRMCVHIKCTSVHTGIHVLCNVFEATESKHHIGT